LLFLAMFTSCKEKEEKEVVRIPPIQIDISNHSIIPMPVSVNATNSSLALTPNTKIFVDTTSGELYKVANFFKDFLNDSIEGEGITGTKAYGNIYLHLNDSITGNEAYELDINEEFIQLTQKGPAGV